MENRGELEHLQTEIRLIAEQTQNEFGTLQPKGWGE
jgi:hypothetical protein